MILRLRCSCCDDGYGLASAPRQILRMRRSSADSGCSRSCIDLYQGQKVSRGQELRRISICPGNLDIRMVLHHSKELAFGVLKALAKYLSVFGR